MSHHALPTDEELLRQILPDDCFWLAPVPGLPVSNLESASNYAAFLDYSHRVNQQDWLYSGASIPKELQAALIEQPVGAFIFHENHCSVLEDQRDLVNDSESSCSSTSSADSSSYHSSGAAQDQKGPRGSTEIVNNSTEPKNLISLALLKNNLPIAEKSTSPKDTKIKTEISNP